MLSLLIALLAGYLASRAIRGGLFRPSVRFTRLDILAIVLLALGLLYSLDVSVRFSF